MYDEWLLGLLLLVSLLSVLRSGTALSLLMVGSVHYNPFWWLPDSLTPLVQITIPPSHPATKPLDTSHSDHLSCPLSPEIITERARRLNVLSHLTTHILPKDNIIAVQSLLWIMRGTRFMDFVRWIWDERDTGRDSHKERLWKGYLINYYKTRDKRPTAKLNNENIIDFPAGQTEA